MPKEICKDVHYANMHDELLRTRHSLGLLGTRGGSLLIRKWKIRASRVPRGFTVRNFVSQVALDANA